MCPARASAPVTVPAFIGRASRPQAPVPAAASLPWPGDPALGYVPTGYQYAPGYPGSLTDGSSLTIQSNTTYSFYKFPVGIVAGAGVNNVTFNGCLFTSGQNGAGSGVGDMCVSINNAPGSTPVNDNWTFSYCTFRPIGLTTPPATGNSYGSGGTTINYAYQYAIFAGTFGQLTADHCDCWGFGNAFVYADGGTLAKPHVYTWNWIHDISQDNTWHSDGIGLPGGGISAGDQIKSNTINCLGNTNALAYQVVAVSGQGNSAWSDFTISGNLFGGYDFTIQLVNGNAVDGLSAPSNITFTGNTFTTQYQCINGPLWDATYISQPHWYWRNNRWKVPAGAYWGHPQYDGYYWVPGYTSNASPTFDEGAGGPGNALVSLTDYTG